MLSTCSKLVWSGLALVVAFGVVLAVSPGCQPSGGGPATYSVSGVVTYQGKPVEGANVIFSPIDPQQGARAEAAKTDAQGRYSAKLAPGEYSVGVTKYSQPAAQATQAGGEYTPPEEGAQAPVAKSELPEKYADAARSPLRLKMEAKDTTFNIDLSN
ncbi:MAG: carboxypeptidase-like regulatory domain-containing protein [Thermoguttaceae bacterium]|nr:carboxypeptidase-like regulatory domain-containing protein [Thermoguttaceae bacterium]MDW8079262.1 carboxypeptidase-like regulatory domain-containing protein [Thermoguttaceae bacterium]